MVTILTGTSFRGAGLIRGEATIYNILYIYIYIYSGVGINKSYMFHNFKQVTSMFTIIR